MNKGIQLILDYVEGRLSASDFKKEFLTNKKLKCLLKRPFDTQREAYRECNYNLFEYFSQEYQLKDNWESINARYVLFTELSRYLEWFKIKFIPYEKYSKEFMLMLDIQPSWLDITDDQGIFDKIIEEIPRDLSKTKQVALGKAKIKELFKYDKTYPRWIQGAEWPIVNGKPLVFSHQSKEQKDDERVYYYFYNPETNEQTVVEQVY